MRALTTLVCLAVAASLGSSAYIARFDLFNTDTGKRVRTIGEGAYIAPTYPFTIVAVTAGKGPVSSVTFTEPVQHTERVAPYSMGGDFPPGKFRALSITDGYYTISAYVNDDQSNPNSFVFTYSRKFDVRGPLPGKVAVDLGGKPELPIPFKLPNCNFSHPSWVNTVEFSDDSIYSKYTGIDSLWSVELTFCDADNGLPNSASKFRVRLLSYIEDTSDTRTDSTVYTKVLAQRIVHASHKQALPTFENIRKTCNELKVYLEFCVRDRETKRALCGTSPFQTLSRVPIPENKPKYRPPIYLKLVPGDSFSLTTTFKVDDSGPDIGSNQPKHGPNSYNLVAVMQQSHSNVAEKTNATLGSSVVNNLRAAITKKVSAADDGAVAFVEYADPACPNNVADTRERFNTTILVDYSYGRLVKQDNALPIFEPLVYPATPYKETVELTVHARNVGGGRRYSEALQSEQPTELYYQWYLKTDDDGATYAEPIPGATGPTLTLSAECDSGNASCNRYGYACKGYRIYSVDVCNTFGCRRSDPLLPRVLPPIGEKAKAGEKWNDCTCQFNVYTFCSFCYICSH